MDTDMTKKKSTKTSVKSTGRAKPLTSNISPTKKPRRYGCGGKLKK